MRSKNIAKLVTSIALPQAAGFVGSLFTISQIELWYTTLVQPDLAPPNWLFGPVWFILYTLMGIALYLVWHRGLTTRAHRFAFWFFIAHLVVNSVWSIVFFGLHNISAALVVILVLWGMIAYLIKLFKHIDTRAAWLLVPYLAWVSFATYLNYSFWMLN